MSPFAIVFFLMMVVWMVFLWVDYTDARAWRAPLGPVPWRYHVRVRWWATPRVKLDLALIALCALLVVLF